MEIERKLNVFGLGKLQDLVTLLDVLEREKISIEDVRNYLKLIVENRGKMEGDLIRMAEERKKVWNKRTRKCPDCGAPLALSPIRTPKGKANKEGYTSLWSCLGEECQFEEYSKKSFTELYKKVMEV